MIKSICDERRTPCPICKKFVAKGEYVYVSPSNYIKYGLDYEQYHITCFKNRAIEYHKQALALLQE